MEKKAKWAEGGEPPQTLSIDRTRDAQLWFRPAGICQVDAEPSWIWTKRELLECALPEAPGLVESRQASCVVRCQRQSPTQQCQPIVT
jgi:hypothetical protein